MRRWPVRYLRAARVGARGCVQCSAEERVRLGQSRAGVVRVRAAPECAKGGCGQRTDHLFNAVQGHGAHLGGGLVLRGHAKAAEVVVRAAVLIDLVPSLQAVLLNSVCGGGGWGGGGVGAGVRAGRSRARFGGGGGGCAPGISVSRMPHRGWAQAVPRILLRVYQRWQHEPMVLSTSRIKSLSLPNQLELSALSECSAVSTNTSMPAARSMRAGAWRGGSRAGCGVGSCSPHS